MKSEKSTFDSLQKVYKAVQFSRDVPPAALDLCRHTLRTQGWFIPLLNPHYPADFRLPLTEEDFEE